MRVEENVLILLKQQNNIQFGIAGIVYLIYDTISIYSRQKYLEISRSIWIYQKLNQWRNSNIIDIVKLFRNIIDRNFYMINAITGIMNSEFLVTYKNCILRHRWFEFLTSLIRINVSQNTVPRDTENVPHKPMRLATDVYICIYYRLIVLFCNVHFLLVARK